MSDEVQRVEVITSVQRRRRWSVPEKVRLVEETLEPGGPPRCARSRRRAHLQPRAAGRGVLSIPHPDHGGPDVSARAVSIRAALGLP
jgi:hypothetical protein